MTNSLTSLASPAEITMTSIALVKYLNDERKLNPDAYATVRHDNFMTRVPKVLGEDAPKFLGTSFYNGNGTAVLSQYIYTFPKREACLMAMSYSYELQAKVFDKMTSFAASTLSMSTREIAELTGKRHDNVLRDFRDVCEALELGLLSFEDTSVNPQNGQTYIQYLLPKDLTTTLVSGYSIPMRHKIVMR